MEYMGGGTLSAAIQCYHFQEKEIAFISREILKALEFLHHRQIIHRFK